jgi:hypothetical protein
MSDLHINLDNLKVDWGNGYPAICAHCGELINTDEPGEDGETEVPLQLFRGEGKDCKMLQFHWNCGVKRMTKAWNSAGPQISFST